MKLTKIWERYFFKETFKTALLFLICFWGVYMLIDYAHHASLFRFGGHFDWQIFALYYGSDFVNKSELLIPLALLLGTIRFLCKLNEDNELVAMMASGVSSKTLLQPFILLGLLATVSMYLRSEFLLPLTTKQLTFIVDSKSSDKESENNHFEAQHMILEDHSTLLFHKYDLSRDLLVDVFWIQSGNQIVRIKELSLKSNPPEGRFVDFFERNQQGQLLLVSYDEEMKFPNMKFNDQMISDAFTPPEALSLTELWNKLPTYQRAESEKQARIVSTFHQKIVFPWLCLLAVVAPAPFCMHYSRRFPVFLVYVGSIFGFMIVYITMNAAHVIGRRQLVDPLLAIWLPFLLFAVPVTWFYFKRR